MQKKTSPISASWVHRNQTHDLGSICGIIFFQSPAPTEPGRRFTDTWTVTPHSDVLNSRPDGLSTDISAPSSAWMIHFCKRHLQATFQYQLSALRKQNGGTDHPGVLPLSLCHALQWEFEEENSFFPIHFFQTHMKINMLSLINTSDCLVLKIFMSSLQREWSTITNGYPLPTVTLI